NALDVHVHRDVPGVLRSVGGPVVVGQAHAGVVVHDVQPAEDAHGLGHGGLHGCRIGDVAGNVYALAPGLLDILDRLGAVVAVHHGHLGALGREHRGCHLAQSGSRAGDQGDLAFQASHVTLHAPV